MEKKWIGIGLGAVMLGALGFGAGKVAANKLASRKNETEQVGEEPPAPPERITSKECPVCGKTVKEYDFFCPFCGGETNFGK